MHDDTRQQDHDDGRRDDDGEVDTGGVTLIVSDLVGVRVVHRGDLEGRQVAQVGRQLARRAAAELTADDVG